MHILISVNLTNPQKISINYIDKIAKVCYTKNKLENKIKNLTNNKQKQKGNKKMVGIETINLPNKVQNANWRDDVAGEFAIYGKTLKGESEYINRQDISKKDMDIIEIKKRNLLRGNKIIPFFKEAKAA